MQLVALPDIWKFGACLHRLVVAVAFLALASPTVGPLLDHHFAERQPDHVHIYSGERVVDHVHPYGLGHSHHSDLPNHPSTGSGHTEGIVYLTSDEGAGPGFISLTAVSMNVETSFPDLGDSSLLLRLGHPDHPLTESFYESQRDLPWYSSRLSDSMFRWARPFQAL